MTNNDATNGQADDANSDTADQTAPTEHDTTELRARPPDDERDVDEDDLPDFAIGHPTSDVDDGYHPPEQRGDSDDGD